MLGGPGASPGERVPYAASGVPSLFSLIVGYHNESHYEMSRAALRAAFFLEGLSQGQLMAGLAALSQKRIVKTMAKIQCRRWVHA
jgi:hypothetical protein